MEQFTNTTSTISEDGQWAWNGTEWVPNTMAASHVSTPPAKKSRKGLKIAAGVVVALLAVSVVAGATGGEGDTPADTSTAASAPANEDAKEDAEAKEAAEAEAAQGAGIGDPVSDGKFTFTVDDVETGVEEVGDEYLNEQAQGEYTLVTITIENTGDEPQTFFADNITGVDSNGNEVAVDSEASYYATDDADAWMEEINPGNSITVTVAFDLAEGSSLDSIEVHDSAFSDGQTITLK